MSQSEHQKTKLQPPTYQYFTFDIWWVDWKLKNPACLKEGIIGKKSWASQAETKIFAPESGWLEDDCYLFGTKLFSGANCWFQGVHLRWITSLDCHQLFCFFLKFDMRLKICAACMSTLPRNYQACSMIVPLLILLEIFRFLLFWDMVVGFAWCFGVVVLDTAYYPFRSWGSKPTIQVVLRTTGKTPYIAVAQIHQTISKNKR